MPKCVFMRFNATSLLHFLTWVILLSFQVPHTVAQERKVVIRGVVRDTLNAPIVSASVVVRGSFQGVPTDGNGQFSITLSERDSVVLRISCLGYNSQEVTIKNLKKTHTDPIEIFLTPSQEQIEGVLVRPVQRRVGNIERISVDGMRSAPNVSGGIESLVKLLPGVSSSNELSSQYSVRGGNFDENLVYVNDVEVFRPFLIRSAQQEGLSFINPDMVGSVEFSSGGFNAEFGDKLSSVLSVRYREPQGFGVKASAGLLGASAAVEGATSSKNFTFVTGVRYKTSRYMLNSLETKGDYYPSFFDWQGTANQKLTDRLSVGFLGNVAANLYSFKPTVRETRFGMFNNTLQLKIYYDGAEKDRYLSSLGALWLSYRISPTFSLKLIGSTYFSAERETYDLLGQYFLNELDNSMGSKTYGDSVINVGIGGFLDHARNYIELNVTSLNVLGDLWLSKSRVKWGFQLQQERLSDELSEWGLVDSSGYAIPYSGNGVGINRFYLASAVISSYRTSGFFQTQTNVTLGEWNYQFSMGIRASYWTFNDELIVSPRTSVSFNHESTKNLEYHISVGLYYQPPFYRELRLPDGQLNSGIKSQQSVHLLAGTEYFFMAWNRPFRLSLEVYNKWLRNLIPYSIDNVRLRYSGDNLAKGYARGVDLKVNGELVKGAESWLSLSLLRTKEDNLFDSFTNQNGETVFPGYYFRPTDQTFSLSLFLQDYLPGNQSFKVNLTGVYGSGLPMTTNDNSLREKTFRMPPYKRIDVGFTKVFFDSRTSISRKRGINEMAISLDIFNLFNFDNTVSYLWVQTVSNQSGTSYRFAVPNYLTSRRVNLRFQVSF